jgi:hypothetical protein
MSVLKPFTQPRFAIHCVIVVAVFMLLDFLYYGLIAPVQPYAQDLVHKFIWTIVLAVPFTLLFYYFNADWWEPRGIRKKGSSPLGRGLFFGIVMGIAFIAIIALSGYVVMYSLIHLLDAFRGVPESAIDDAIIIIEAGVAGTALAHTGKEESDVDQFRPPES